MVQGDSGRGIVVKICTGEKSELKVDVSKRLMPFVPIGAIGCAQHLLSPA